MRGMGRFLGLGRRATPSLARGPFSASNWFTKPGFAVTTTYTIELLVHIADFTAADQVFLLSAYDGSRGFSVFLNINGANLVAYTATPYEFAPSFALSNADDAHGALLTFTCDGVTLRAYLNGAEVGRGTTIVNPTGAGTATLSVGALPDGTLPFIGSMLYAAITDTALTEVQVRDRSRSIMARSFPALPGSATVLIAGNTGDASGLTEHGTMPSVAVPTPFPWIKYSGRISIVGDSTDKGATALQSGYVGPLLDLLLANGNHYLQPSPDASIFIGSQNIFATRGIFGSPYAGSSISDYLHVGAYPLDTECATYRPYWLFFGPGYNDIRGTVDITNATLAARVIAVLDEVLAVCPWTTPILKYLLTSESDDVAAWPAMNYANYVAATLSWQTVGRQLVVDHYAALGVTVLLEGPYASEPVKEAEITGRVHPIQGPTGYDLMAPPVYDVIIGAKAA